MMVLITTPDEDFNDDGAVMRLTMLMQLWRFDALGAVSKAKAAKSRSEAAKRTRAPPALPRASGLLRFGAAWSRRRSAVRRRVPRDSNIP